MSYARIDEFTPEASVLAEVRPCTCPGCAQPDDKVSAGPGQGGNAPPQTVDTVAASTATTATATLGGYISGTIDSDGDHDWYSVNLLQGQTYTFSTILNGTLSDSVLALRDSTGALISENDDVISGGNQLFSEITFTATTAGVYYLDVGGFAPQGGASDTGTFLLTATRPASDAIGHTSATAATLSIGGAVNGTIEAAGDHDWFAVQLTAGQAYQFTTEAIVGGNLDTVLYIRDASGNPLAFNDDTAGTQFSKIRFVAPTTGTYYIDLGVWGNQQPGSYRVAAAVAPPLEVFTYDQIATQLTSTYWGGASRHFNVAPGGTITVDITKLTADGQFLAREALNLWTDATGIIFSEVSSGGQIDFDDNADGAFSTSSIGTFIISSQVNVSTAWLTTSGTTLRSYSFQTYVHEIGHALGLGHAGPYNTTADYALDATYLNDAWSTTVMSYFSQTENTYFAGQGFNRLYAESPMVADLVAITSLYGAATTTRTGDTVYGFGNTSGRAIYDAAVGQTPIAVTIVDHGGVDTLDYSGYSSNARVNLNAETFSNVGNQVGNVSIARGTIIENVRTGSGADTIIGNAVGNSLDGGSGNDVLIGGSGFDVGVFSGSRSFYTIRAIGDGSVSVSDSRAGADGVDVLQQVERLQFADTVVSLPTGFDFDGDYIGDLLFRSRTGLLASWQLSGASAIDGGGNIANPGSAWQFVLSGDFNGDGARDLLFRGRTGTLSSWQLAGTTVVGGGTLGDPGPNWAAVGTGDFNADGTSDLLFRNAVSGAFATWDMNGTAITGGGTIGTPGFAWTFKATGDFNGDGKSDILFQNVDGTLATWMLNDTAISGGGSIGNPGAGWFFRGVGDFNGDGKSDLLFQNAGGSYATWDLNGTAIIGGGTLGNPGSSWALSGIGDYNGDGRSDLAFRHADGRVATWTLSDFTITGGGTLGNPGSVFSVADGLGANTFANLVFQRADSTVASWVLNGTANVGGATFGTPGAGWTALAVADFGGTGESDVLFRSAAGVLALWRTDGTHQLGGVTVGDPGAGWSYRAVGDFNGDGKGDILFQHSDGRYATWDMAGGTIVGGGAIGTAAGFTFVAAGDMNGDGKSDMLFVDALGNYAAWFMSDTEIIGGGTIGNPGAGWAFEGLGDFNGDGSADMLFRNASATLASWNLDGTAIIGGGTMGSPGASLDLVKIADLNSDGRSDLIFANAAGNHTAWLMDNISILSSGSIGSVSTDWHLV